MSPLVKYIRKRNFCARMCNRMQLSENPESLIQADIDELREMLEADLGPKKLAKYPGTEGEVAQLKAAFDELRRVDAERRRQAASRKAAPRP